MSDDFDWEEDAVAEAVFFLSDESARLTLAQVRETWSPFANAS